MNLTNLTVRYCYETYDHNSEKYKDFDKKNLCSFVQQNEDASGNKKEM
jgi:hypothetical protein